MTFLEAAIAILQREGKPMHFKKLTEIAIRENLLTVIGRVPEQTMQQRLNDALKKSDPQLVLTREKPGVFGLRYYAGRASSIPAAGSSSGGASATQAPEALDTTDGGDAAEPGGGPRPPAAAERPGQGDERRRRRRRGGRGRRGGAEGGAPGAGAEAKGGAESEAELESLAAEEGADEGEAARGQEERAAPEGARAPSGTRPVEPRAAAEAGAAPPEIVHALSERDTGAPAGEARPSLYGPPERRSFAEAAAAVAAAHRQLAALQAQGTGAAMLPVAAQISDGEPRTPPAPAVAAPPAATPPHPAPAPSAPAVEGVEAAAQGEGSFDDEDIDMPSGPMIAPAFGTEELVRGEDHRPVYEEPRIRRRHRDREGAREQGRPGAQQGKPPAQQGKPPAQHGKPPAQHGKPPAQHGKPPAPQGKPSAPQGKPPALQGKPPAPQVALPAPQAKPPAAPAEPAEPQIPSPAASPAPVAARPVEGDLVEAAMEILRGGDGRPIHARQIIEMALKRKLLKGDAADLVRLLRIAVHADLRERETAGLRARVRPTGGSNYAYGERRLEPELGQQERELGERAQRLTAASRAALVRRMAALPAPAFESLMRLLVARLGISGLELVKRGEGVAYLGGDRDRGALQRRVLIAMRPGAQPLGRRAVGELRAGLKARGFAEGLILSAGPALAEALVELETAAPIEIHDAERLGALLAEQHLGVTRRIVPVETLDPELFAELTEG